VLSRSKRAFVDKLNTTGDSPVSRLNRTVIKTALPDPPSPEPKPFEWQIVTSMCLILFNHLYCVCYVPAYVEMKRPAAASTSA